MNEDFKLKLYQLMRGDLSDWQVRIIDAILDEYEFNCQSFVYAGPGHQSRHECTDHRPHPIEGEHRDDLYEWVGTSEEQVKVYYDEILKKNRTRRTLIKNAPHGPCYCGNSPR